jgi:hypothetical protein
VIKKNVTEPTQAKRPIRISAGEMPVSQTTRRIDRGVQTIPFVTGVWEDSSQFHSIAGRHFMKPEKLIPKGYRANP